MTAPLDTLAAMADQAADLVITAATSAGGQVYTPDDWPTHESEYPVVLIQAFSEDRVGQGRGTIEFTCTGTIRFTLRATAPGQISDEGAAAAYAQLYLLKNQVEVAVINAPAMMLLGIQFFPFVRSRFGMSATGEYHEAELQLDLGVEYYQGPEYFAPTPETAIDEITLQTPATDPDWPAVAS